MGKTIIRNMTEGSVFRQLAAFSLPLLLANSLQTLYTTVDTLVVGRFVGTAALSAVSTCGELVNFYSMIGMGLASAGQIIIAQFVGKDDKESVGKTIGAMFSTLTVLAVLFSALCILTLDRQLQWIKLPAEALADGRRYTLVSAVGFVFIYGYNAVSAALRGMGDSKRPLYFVLIACITNVILDLVLVAGLKMGALGAAIATVFSQAVSMITCIIVMIRNDVVFDFKPSSFIIKREKAVKILKLGTPTAIQNGVTSISFMIITTLVNVIGGVNASAAVGVVAKFNSFAVLPAVAMGASISTMCAQNIGAGKWDRAVKTCKIGTVIAFCISGCIFIVAQTSFEHILRLFNDEPEMIKYGVQYIRTFSFDYLLMPFVFCINGLFTGAGHTAFSMVNNMLSAIILRVPVAVSFGLVLHLGLTGVGLGGPIASVGSIILIVVFLISGRWKENKAL